MATTVKPIKLEKTKSREIASSSLLRDTLKHVFHNRSAVLGLILIGAVLLGFWRYEGRRLQL